MPIAKKRNEIDLEVQTLLNFLKGYFGFFETRDLSICTSGVSRFNAEKFVLLTLRNGLAGIVYVLNNKSDVLPKECVTPLEQSYRSTGLSNLVQLVELLHVIGVLNKGYVDAVPLKGVLDAEEVFGDLAVYPSSDIDLLFRESVLPFLPEILNKHGYKAVENITEEDLLVSHYHLIYKKDGFAVELHWNLVKRYFKVPSEFWWDDVRKRSYSGVEFFQLSTEKYLLYLIFRLFDHQFSPLKFWVHLAAVIQKSSKVDWEKLLEMAKEVGMERLTLFCLRAVHEMLGVESPIASRPQILGYQKLYELVLKHNTSTVKKPHVVMATFTAYLLPPFVVLRIFLSMIFPPASEVRLRYQLPPGSKLVFLYRILNPLLMMIRKKND